MLTSREDRIAVLLGIDESDRKSRRGAMSAAEVAQSEAAYANALAAVSNTLDLNYYYLGDKQA